MTRSIFYCFGAYVGTIKSKTECDWWYDDPASLGWKPGALVPVDLGKNVKAVRAGTIKLPDLQCDDYLLDQGLNTAGPLWPGGQPIGSIWLEETYWKNLGAKQPPRQPPSAPNDCHDYELQSILYWDDDKPELKNRKFQGYHAKIVGSQGKTVAQVELWSAGTSKVARPWATVWIDLAQAHPVDPIATQISIGGQLEGALFLDRRTTMTMSGPGGPKRPPSSGF